MAVVKLGTSKSANRLINYCERRSDEREGVNCDLARVKEQFKLERSLWGKEDGIQAHHVIMSFPPLIDNLKPYEVAEAGKELAEKIAPGHAAAIYVHTDRDHLHAHIVINSVNAETGKKLHLRPSDYFKTQELSDEICKQRGWHVIQEKQSPERYTLAERELNSKGKTTWKDELRSWIKEGQGYTKNLQELKTFLHKTYGVEMKIQEKNISYLHPESQKYVRGKTLGHDFTKEGLKYGYELERETKTIGAARHSARTNERNIEPAVRFNQADKFTAQRISETRRQYGEPSKTSSQNERRAEDALYKGRAELNAAISGVNSSTNTTEQKYREPSSKLESTNLQHERENHHVPVSRTERSSSLDISNPDIKDFLDVISQGIKQMEAKNEKEQAHREKQFRQVNDERDRSR